MKKSVIYSLLAIVAVVLSACSTSKSTVSKNSDLSKYEYASIINNDTYHLPAQLMEYEIQLYDAVADSRLKLVSDVRMYELSQSQQERLLMVKWGVDPGEYETIVTVNFIDYMTGRPVASCKGGYGMSLTRTGDLKGAINRVAKQISEIFPK